MDRPLYAKIAVATNLYILDIPYTYAVPESVRDIACVGMRVIVPFGQGNVKTEGIILSLSDSSDYAKVKSIQSFLDKEPVLDAAMIKIVLWLRKNVFCTIWQALHAVLPSGIWFRVEDACSLVSGFSMQEAFSIVEGSDASLRSVLEYLYAHNGFATVTELQTVILDTKKLTKAIKALATFGIAETNVKTRQKSSEKTAEIVTLAVSHEEAEASLTGKPSPVQRALLRFLMENGTVSKHDLLYFTGASGTSLKALISKGLVYTTEQEVFRRPAVSVSKATDLVLNISQLEAFEYFQAQISEKSPGCGLLFGITGSGKTSVYIKLIEQTLNSGNGCLVLVPEIALTPQLMELFTSHFGDNVAILHSCLAIGERYDEWKRIRNGSARLVIGTRSAIFAPITNLKLIIMDEEHELTYKSETSPRYHARTVAKYRCMLTGAYLLLGSATPSIESMYAAKNGTYGYFELIYRYNQQELPYVISADLKSELKSGNDTTISSVLYNEIRKNLQADEQTILFLNRRGTSRQLVCKECGNAPTCSRCSMKLTYHSANARLMCHMCGLSIKLPDTCPECGGDYKTSGAGTQKVVQDLQELFPETPVLRMDADTTGGKTSAQSILTDFRQKNVPILVGTQMITKGLNFPNVTLVGVIYADNSLMTPDFRANERTFSLITQVIGRGGRGQKSGRAVLQAFSPQHPVLLHASAQNYHEFYSSEIELRRCQGLPPFSSMTRLTLFSISQDNCQKACARLRTVIDNAVQSSSIRVLGPAPATVLKVDMRYRYCFTLLGETAPLRDLTTSLLTAFGKDRLNKGVTLYADPDPIG